MADDVTKADSQWAWSPFEPDAKRPCDRAAAAHLYRRAGFAASTAQLDVALKRSPQDVVAQLMQPADAKGHFADEMARMGDSMLASGNARNLSAWWLYRMLYTPDPLLEKLTLFWHGHFATSAAKVTDPKLMLAQNELLRTHARGSFREMVAGIARDPAMLLYLDSATNRKLHPNENFAREVMELFCLGLGNYTERDIQEVARSFTGWEVRRGEFQFNPYQHDEGIKSFLNQSGNFDGDDAVRIVLEQPAAPRFIATKLIRFFVFDEPEPPAALVDPLAEELVAGDWNVGPIVQRILASQLFFSPMATAHKVRSPVELAVGLLRTLEGTTNLYRLAEEVDQIGQAPFFPTNVKGWDGGRAWINSASLLGRANLVRRVVDDQNSRFAGGPLIGLFNRHNLDTSEKAVDWVLGLLVATPLPDESRAKLIDLAENGPGDRSQRLSDMVHTISTLPEFQLS